MKLLEGIDFIITHIKREENKEADKLANGAMDEEVVRIRMRGYNGRVGNNCWTAMH